MRRSESKRRGSSGFTLTEVVIASILLAIVTTGIAFFFLRIIGMSDEMDDRVHALEIAREGIELARTQDVVSMDDGWQPSEILGKYTRALWIDTPYPLYPEAKQVMCRVTWSNADGADSLSLQTIF